MSDVLVTDNKVFVADEGHWITINGNHVLINEKGEVMAGMGGKFIGRKISKLNAHYPKTKEEIEAARKEAMERRSEAAKEREAVENSKDYKKAEQGIKKIDKEMDSRYYRSWRNPERHASLEALREQYKDQKDALVKASREKFNKADRQVDALLDLEKQGKNGIFTNQTAKRNRLAKSIANAERVMKNRADKINEKVSAIKERYNKMADRIENRYKDSKDWSKKHDARMLASAVQRRGQEKAENIQRTAREGLAFASRKRDALFENRYDLKETNKKINALKKLKNATASKIANAKQANAAIAKLKGTRIEKATPNMVGGRFTNQTQERNKIQGKIDEMHNSSAKRMKRELDRYDKEYDKLIERRDEVNKGSGKWGRYNNAIARLEKNPDKYNKLINRVKEKRDEYAGKYNRKHEEIDKDIANLHKNSEARRANIMKQHQEARQPLLGQYFKKDKEIESAKAALAKARPKIAERRKAVANYNAKASKAWLAKNAAKADSGTMTKAEQLEWNKHVRNVKKVDPNLYEYTEFTKQNGKPLEE